MLYKKPHRTNDQWTTVPEKRKDEEDENKNSQTRGKYRRIEEEEEEEDKEDINPIKERRLKERDDAITAMKITQSKELVI